MKYICYNFQEQSSSDRHLFFFVFIHYSLLNIFFICDYHFIWTVGSRAIQSTSFWFWWDNKFLQNKQLNKRKELCFTVNETGERENCRFCNSQNFWNGFFQPFHGSIETNTVCVYRYLRIWEWFFVSNFSNWSAKIVVLHRQLLH